MISGAKAAVETLVLQRQDEKTISPRLLELRKKIQDEDYIDNAILRIAQVISRKLVEQPEELHYQCNLHPEFFFLIPINEEK